MSGFEVAGIVLGSIPLLISALEHYGDGVRTIKTWMRYENELRRVIRNLKTERVRFLNVCEKLLDGLVPASRIDSMVEDPFGNLWQEKDTQRKIRARLWRSWDAFEQTVTAMKVAIEKTLDKLEAGKKTKEGESSSVMKELKRARFTFKLSAYDELLSTIREGVSSLESLTAMSIDLEPKRRARSDVRFLAILRELSSSMYRAVTSSLACACKHRMLMRLSSWSADITPDHEEDEIIKDLKFCLALSSESVRQTAQTDSEDLTENLYTLSWKELVLQVNTAHAQSHHQNQSEVASRIASVTEAKVDCARPQLAKKRGKTVNFASFKSLTTTTTVTETPTVTSTITRDTTIRQSEDASPISSLVSKMTVEVASIALSSAGSTLDLCGQLRKNSTLRTNQNHRQKLDCYGVILDPDLDPTSQKRRSYSVYPAPSLMPEITWSWKVVSLRDVLEGKEGLPPLGYRHRLQLAVFITRSVFQFYDTPWLPETPSSRNVYFIIQRGDSQYSKVYSYYEHAFVMAASGGGANKGKESAIIPLIRNPTLLALGVLLIELEKNKTIDSMRLPEECFTGGGQQQQQRQSSQDLLSDYMTAKRLLSEVYQSSSNYGSAVRRCLDCEFRAAGGATSMTSTLDLENEDFRQEVYGGVVALLEEDLGRV